jgi:hypothetical protein
MHTAPALLSQLRRIASRVGPVRLGYLVAFAARVRSAFTWLVLLRTIPEVF